MPPISKYQIITMIVLFQIGSTTIFQLGIEAGNRSWIVLVISMVIGYGLLAIFLSIQNMNPDKDLVQMWIEYLGPIFGRALGFLYIIWFAYESMRSIRDFGEISNMTFLIKTPISVIMLIMMTMCVYAIIKGTDTLFRLAELIMPLIMLSYLILFILFISSGVIRVQNLLPILNGGFKPILKPIITGGPIWFPFGQMIIFLMFWRLLNDKGKLRKVTFLSYTLTGILLIVLNILNITLLGAAYAELSTLPFLSSVRLIKVGDFIERVDPLVVLLIFAEVFFKSSLFFMAAVLGLTRILNIGFTKLVIPVGALIYFASFYAPNWAAHTKAGTLIGRPSNPVLILVLPLILLIIIKIKKGKNDKNVP